MYFTYILEAILYKVNNFFNFGICQNTLEIVSKNTYLSLKQLKGEEKENYELFNYF